MKTNRCNNTDTTTAPAQGTVNNLSSREIAYHALLHVFKKGGYLAQYFKKPNPLAEEIAYGTLRYHLLLEKIMKRLGVKLKVKARLLFLSALYQLEYMNAPAYAVVNETIEIAKRACPYQAALFNATLRRYEKANLPVACAYPEDFVEKMRRAYPSDFEQIFEILCTRFSPFSREIGTDIFHKGVIVENCYVQNPTPYQLMHRLSKNSPRPKKILDMCAAPGGKSLILHELYPDAELYCNEPNPKRAERLKENLERFGVRANFLNCDGCEITGEFDLVVIDAPCSGTGVMHKKPEARLRLDQTSELISLQKRLIAHAKTLSPLVWYLTCSILPEENHTGANSFTQLPTFEGLDGGYCAIIG
ncbi:MAG: hypothetical protein MRY21_00175 [Simkaniaceae bacterium]|nr:hypothetical protein [Simkaniaceae bacterium]